MSTGSMICFGIGIMICNPLEDQKPVPPPANTYCQIKTAPIRWHASDTRGTKEKIDTENRVWKRLCRPAPSS